ncbi:MAG: Lpg1974 family pore-forming outer membrane protein, partial [Methylococcales bacterium]
VLAKQQLNQSFVDPEEPSEKEGFFMSAGGLYVRPLIDSKFTISDSNIGVRMAGNEMDYEPGFQVSLGYQAADNWDYRLKFKHFSAKEKATLGSDSDSIWLEQ